MKRITLFGFAVLVAAVMAFGCSGGGGNGEGGGGDEQKPLAQVNLSEGERCTPVDTCAEGLSCVSEICVKAEGGGGGGADKPPVEAPIYIITEITCPAMFIKDTGGQILFKANAEGLKFSCSIDGTVATECSSPFAFTGLTDGAHKFNVVGVDERGIKSQEATCQWEVDIKAPVALLQDPPPNLANQTEVKIFVVGDDVSAYKVKLDNGDWGPEISKFNPIVFGGLAEGVHQIQVVARDIVGNWQAEDVATKFSWTIDSEAPTAVLGGLPAKFTQSVTATINVGGDGVVAYKMKLDNGLVQDELTIDKPISLTDLAEGSHTVSVFGKDTAGNWQKSATTYIWTVDKTPPVIASFAVEAPGGMALVLTWGATDNITDAQDLNYQLIQADGGITKFSCGENCSVFTFKDAPLIKKFYTYKLNVCDKAGNCADKQVKGIPIAVAGDVNGDGYPDLVVGAPMADPSQNTPDAGKGYLYLGGEKEMSKDSLALIIECGYAGGDLGRSVAMGGI